MTLFLRRVPTGNLRTGNKSTLRSIYKSTLEGMMTSSNGNIFRVTGPLCGEFTGPGEFPAQMSVTRSFDVFFGLRLNKRLSKQPWGWWFETPSWSLWRQCNGTIHVFTGKTMYISHFHADFASGVKTPGKWMPKSTKTSASYMEFLLKDSDNYSSATKEVRDS